MYWLPGLILIPLVALVALIAAPARAARWVALAGTLCCFIWNIFAAMTFAWSGDGFDPNLEVNVGWLDQYGVAFTMSVDSVSMLLVLLTTFLMPLCVWGSFSAIGDRVKEYYGWLLGIEAAMVGVFLARDLIFFYICFEFTLVPMYFLIALYGGGNRAAAATKFFLFTFTGSLITLAGLLYIAWQYSTWHGGQWTFSIAELTEFAATTLTPAQQAWVLLALLAGFAVKVPLFPVHTWLPLAHTEAPTAGSVILAAVLLKLGTYGLYRFVLPMVPDAVVEYAPVIAVLSIVGILYAALICWVQTDVKKLIAYSSVSHLGFCVLGLFALNPLGAQGSVLYMLNHGLSTGALFFCIGMIYERFHTREMDQMSGLARVMPVWAFFMVFFTMSSVGLPGLNGFVSEFLCLIGAFTATGDEIGGEILRAYPGVLGPWFAAAAGAGMIAAAMYLLIMLGKVVFGPVKLPGESGHIHEGGHLPADLSLREIGVLTPIAILCVVLGLYPKPLTDAMENSIEATLSQYPDTVRDAIVATSHDQPVTDHELAGASELRFEISDLGGVP
jgi:NADH-quinone oxidoreductase subunit M